MNLRICFPIHFNGRRISYTCNMIGLYMNEIGFYVEITAPSISKSVDDSVLRPIFSEIFGRSIGFFGRKSVMRLTEEIFLRRIEDGDPVYLWSNCSSDFVRRLNESDSTVFIEKFNGLVSVAKSLLDVAYDRAGLEPAHGLREAMISSDLERIHLSDYVFVANPISAANMVSHGVPVEKIIHSSYGWDPVRMVPRPGFVRKNKRITFVFVAVAEIRKGTNLLLDAWIRANLDADLVMAGPISEEIRGLCADALNREDVVQLGWTDNLAEVYHSADVFLFPTHDEGGPLVTFEAMGCGLPVIVSPMGATTVARDGLDGYVIDPYDIEGWVDAMRRLAGDAELRREMGANARARALEFTWDKVGAQRRRAVLERVNA